MKQYARFFPLLLVALTLMSVVRYYRDNTGAPQARRRGAANRRGGCATRADPSAHRYAHAHTDAGSSQLAKRIAAKGTAGRRISHPGEDGGYWRAQSDELTGFLAHKCCMVTLSGKAPPAL